MLDLIFTGVQGLLGAVLGFRARADTAQGVEL